MGGHNKQASVKAASEQFLLFHPDNVIRQEAKRKLLTD